MKMNETKYFVHPIIKSNNYSSLEVKSTINNGMDREKDP